MSYRIVENVQTPLKLVTGLNLRSQALPNSKQELEVHEHALKEAVDDLKSYVTDPDNNDRQIQFSKLVSKLKKGEGIMAPSGRRWSRGSDGDIYYNSQGKADNSWVSLSTNLWAASADSKTFTTINNILTGRTGTPDHFKDKEGNIYARHSEKPVSSNSIVSGQLIRPKDGIYTLVNEDGTLSKAIKGDNGDLKRYKEK